MVDSLRQKLVIGIAPDRRGSPTSQDVIGSPSKCFEGRGGLGVVNGRQHWLYMCPAYYKQAQQETVT